MSGLTTTGYEAKTPEEITADLEARARAEFGPTIRTDSASLMGMLIAIMVDALLPEWELSQALYDSFNPDNATGTALDNIAGIVGLVREPATAASGTVTLTGADLTVIPAGSIVSAPTLDDAPFLTATEVTIGATISGEVDVAVEAEDPGFLVVLATEVDTIITPISGWSGVVNAADFPDDGSAVESDSELRIRREQSLQIVGAGTDNAIRSNVAALDDVDTALVISNRTLVVDVNGTPGKAFLTVVWPAVGVDAERVAETIFEFMPSGVLPFGAESFDVTDEQGVTQTVSFSYATELAIDIEIDLTTKAGFPLDGIAQVNNAVLKAFSGALDSDPQALMDLVGGGTGVGDDVEVLYLSCAAKTVAGIKSLVIRLSIKPAPPAASVDIAVALTEIATLDAADLLTVVV